MYLAVLVCAGCITARPLPPPQRPLDWAQPAAQQGLPNLYRVHGDLWRSALPDAQGFAAAKARGIRTIVNLRTHADASTPEGVAMLHIPLRTWHVTQEDILAFLRIANDPSKRPLLVHCQHGADRTGIMIAAYRVVVQGWSKSDALAEMRRGGFGYHPVWTNLPRSLQRLDVAAMRRELHLSATPVCSTNAKNAC